MTIQELCDRLSQFPPDTPVVISGYEGGLNDVTIIESLEIQLNTNTESFYGAHSSYLSTDSDKQIWVYRLNHADLALTYPEAFAEQRFQPKMCSC